MQVKVILLLVLVVGAFSQDVQVNQMLKEIEASQIGNTLLKTVEVQLQSSDPLDNLVDSLFVVEQQYQRDQREDDETNMNFQKQCDEDLSALDTEIATLERRKTELQGVVDQLKEDLSQRQGQLKAKNLARQDVNKEIAAIDAQRQKEAEEFEQKRQEMQFAVGVIQEAKQIFQSSFQGSFLQTNAQLNPQILIQANEHFKKIAIETVKQRFNKPFSHIFSYLAQMSTKSQSPELVQKIITLCEQLQKKVDESWALERNAENQRVRSYESYKGLLNKDLNKYNSQIANLEAAIASLENQLTNNTEALNDVTQRLNDKTQRKDDRRSECQEAAFEYQQRRMSRDNDKQTVSDLIGIVHSNLRALKEYMALKQSAGSKSS